jgi:hypothetical protein
VGSSMLGGCSGAMEEGVESEDVAVLEELLDSNVATCGAATANQTYTNMLPSPAFITPATYAAGANGCANAYFVDVNDYRTNFGGYYSRIVWGDTVPTTEATCLARKVKVFVFEKPATGAAIFVDQKTVTGTWIPGVSPFCELPAVNVDSPQVGFPGAFTLTTGKNYKFAISADTGGANPTMKKIKLVRIKRPRPI